MTIGEEISSEPILKAVPITLANQQNPSRLQDLMKFLPLLAWGGVILFYYQVPNYINLAATDLYPALLGVLMAGYLILLGFSFANARLDQTLQSKTPLLIAFALALILWDFLTLKTAKMPLPYFPWPDKILNALVKERQVLGTSLLCTLRLLGNGYFFGGLVGLVTGILMGWNRNWHYWLTPLIKAIGPIPAVTWIPLVMILFPTSYMGSVFLIALAVWFPVTLMTSSGIAGVKNSYFEVARTLGADDQYLIFHVAVPAALPNIFLGLFQGMGVACATLVVAEMMGVKAGLGWYITWATGWAEYDKVYASLILIFIMFSSVITLLFKVRDRVLSWQKGVIKW